MQQAVRYNLMPLNLDENSFIAQQRTMEPSLVARLATQLQNFRIDAEAIVLGCDGEKDASLYRIDDAGVVTDHSGIGFVSIGSGGIHTSAHFMLESYTNATTYFRALYQTFKAKKRAEVAPGVGAYTDMFLITRTAASTINREIIQALEDIHTEDMARTKRLPEEAEQRLVEAHKSLLPQPSEPPPTAEPTSGVNSSGFGQVG